MYSRSRSGKKHDMFITILKAWKTTHKERAADIRDVTNVYWQTLLGVKNYKPSFYQWRSDCDCTWLDTIWLAQLDKNFVSFCNQHRWTYKPLSYHGTCTLEIAAVLVQTTSLKSLKTVTSLLLTGSLVRLLSTQLMNKRQNLKQLVKLMRNKKLNGRSWKMLKQWLLICKHLSWLLISVIQKTLKVLTTTVQKLLDLPYRVLVHWFLKDFPTEDEQCEAYKAVLEGMNGKPVVVRTMDIAEIRNSYLICLTKWTYLGFRALRISISETGDAMFTQTVLFFKRSVHGQLRIMSQWLRSWKNSVQRKQSWWRKSKLCQGVAAADNIRWYHDRDLGSYACRPILAKKLTLFSIGTNDLDPIYNGSRPYGNEQVSYLTNHTTYQLTLGLTMWSKQLTLKVNGWYVWWDGWWPNKPPTCRNGLGWVLMSATSVLRTRSLDEETRHS